MIELTKEKNEFPLKKLWSLKWCHIRHHLSSENILGDFKCRKYHLVFCYKKKTQYFKILFYSKMDGGGTHL